MKRILICSILCFVLGYQNLYGQCDFVTPPAVKKINYASREITFSDVTMNGKTTTYLAVNKGESVKITTSLQSRQNGDYCPACIVQIYWGIRGYTSECANSYYGYQFKRKTSTHNFKAPMEDGIYYITMGGTLDYSCKNSVFRPSCSPDDAFAVLKVGNPDPEQKITLTKVAKGANQFLKTSLVKSGCFGKPDKIEWFLDGNKLAFDNQEEIPLTTLGTYKVLWSNCLTSIADSIDHASNQQKMVTYTFELDTKPSVATEESIVTTAEPELEAGSLAEQIENNDKIVLTHLIFDLGKAILKPEAKEELNKLAQIMRNQPTMRILLEGHTDQRGSANKNLILSEQRVKSAKAYLADQGINGSKIETKGWGHQKPLIVTKDKEEGKINRRVEVRILSR
jgi:outer membrane protein OmpA-like peptidoglycan-associated protein